MKKALILMVLMFLVKGAYASEKKEQLALELLELSHLQQRLDTTIHSYSAQMLQVIPALTKEELHDYFQMAMGWDVLKPQLTKVVSELYTEEELEGVIEFLKTPIGKAYSEKSTLFAQKFTEIVMGNLQQAVQYLKTQLESKQKTDK